MFEQQRAAAARTRASQDHVAKRRGETSDDVFKDVATLNQLRKLAVNLRGEEISASTGCVANFLRLAEHRLTSREAALSAEGLEQHFDKISYLATTMIMPFVRPMAIKQ